MLNTNNTTILCIDIQDKLTKMLDNCEKVKNNSIKLMKAASVLNINTIITEQYPKGLGSTIDEIKNIANFKTIEKTTFSALQTLDFPEITSENVVLFGIETHICVYQTALDLINKGKHVHIVEDCSSSRSCHNHNTALGALKQQGAIVETLEMILFQFLKSSKHPNFKEIQSLIK